MAKIAVIVTSGGKAYMLNGGDLERVVRVFELPPDASQFIAESQGQYATVALAIVKDSQ